MMDANELKGKTGVITGATSGIGLALALSLLQKGAKLFLLGRSFDRLQEHIDRLKGFQDYSFVPLDFEQGISGQESIEILKSENKLDFLIHCAGYISLGTMEDDKLENLDKQYLINVRAPYELTKLLVSKLKKVQGQVIFLNSTTGLSAWEGIGQYSASKHALKSIADSLRKEVSKDGIRVTSLFLGSVDTPMQVKVQKLRGIPYDKDKFLKPEDISDLIIYLLRLPKNFALTDLTVRPTN